MLFRRPLSPVKAFCGGSVVTLNFARNILKTVFWSMPGVAPFFRNIHKVKFTVYCFPRNFKFTISIHKKFEKS